MTALTQAITEALFHSLWQGVLVASLLWITLFLLRGRSANARYLAAVAALFGLFALSLVTGWTVYEKPQPLVLESRAQLWLAVDSGVTWVTTANAWAFPLWAVGVTLFSLRLIWACFRISAWRSKGTLADEALTKAVSALAERMGVRRHVDVLISSLADAPGMIGWLRPILLVPAATVSGLRPQQLELILAHELAHIRRHDYLVNIGQMVVETLLFYHPAMWWASRQIRRERELACDDLAVKAVGDALSYARALTALEKTRVLAPNPAMGSTRGPLMYRIQRLVAPQGREPGPSKLAGVTVLVLLSVTCLFFTMSRASAQATKAVPSPNAPQLQQALQEAREFLKTQVDRAKADLENADHKLQDYSRDNGFLLLAGGGVEEKQNSEVARLMALQAALTDAQIEGFQKEAVARVTEEEVRNGNAGATSAEMVGLRREEAKLVLSFGPATQAVQQVRAQMEVVERALHAEAIAAVQRVQADLRITVVKQEKLKDELEKQRSRLNLTAERLVEFQILKREAETNRRRYDELVNRLQEAQGLQ